MKKLSYIFIAIVSLTFFACTADPMLYAVNKETELFKPKILGNIYSIVQLNDNLYLANGRIFTKNVNDKILKYNPDNQKENWNWTQLIGSELKDPQDRKLVIAKAYGPTQKYEYYEEEVNEPAIRVGIGDDKSCLYFVTVRNNQDDEETAGVYVIYHAELDSEGKITKYTEVELPEDYIVREFLSDGANSWAIVNNDNTTDKAFKIYNGKIDVTGTPDEEAEGKKIISTENATKLQSVVTLNGSSPYFHSTPHMVASFDNNYCYVASTGKIEYTTTPTDKSSWKSVSVKDFSQEVYSICYYEYNGQKKLLIGVASGYFEILLNDDGSVPETASRQTPDNNFDVTFGTHYVIKLFAPQVSEGQAGTASIFAGVLEKNDDESGSKYSGLWGFYPGRMAENGTEKGEWNYE